jgi:hypothetical protein
MSPAPPPPDSNDLAWLNAPWTKEERADINAGLAEVGDALPVEEVPASLWTPPTDLESYRLAKKADTAEFRAWKAGLKPGKPGFDFAFQVDVEEDAEDLKRVAQEWSVCDADGLKDP